MVNYKHTLIFVIAIYFSCCSEKKPEITKLKGKPMPSFKILLEDSITYIDTKDIPIGKPVILLYFGPHCPYSRAQIEEIIDGMENLKDIRFLVFTTWPFMDMRKFYSDYKLNKYSNMYVGIDYTNFFGEYFEAYAVPYMAIYGKDKRLKKAFVGKLYSKQIMKIILE